ncbi:hypothetical protein KOW79_004749 [Hemibagrus wyckioides]|uniref:Uncharacterized protein n=1 Tax=Hemibagrus wyckioides TaxID=337641 RepID=A0A9D3P0Q5_9TELE|nr:hypothetical protein KOW79_004749 [Hemibagrus wyckioides]
MSATTSTEIAVVKEKSGSGGQETIGPSEKTAKTEYLDVVEEATNLSEFTDEILSCGYTGTFNMDQKDAIIRAIVFHAILRVTPMPGDLRKGLRLYGFLRNILKEHPNLCKSLFLPGRIAHQMLTTFSAKLLLK